MLTTSPSLFSELIALVVQYSPKHLKAEEDAVDGN